MYNGSTFGVQEMTDAYARKLIDEAIVELSQMIRRKEKALEVMWLLLTIWVSINSSI